MHTLIRAIYQTKGGPSPRRNRETAGRDPAGNALGPGGQVLGHGKYRYEPDIASAIYDLE